VAAGKEQGCSVRVGKAARCGAVRGDTNTRRACGRVLRGGDTEAGSGGGAMVPWQVRRGSVQRGA
jgi:hypothetical protein